ALAVVVVIYRKFSPSDEKKEFSKNPSCDACAFKGEVCLGKAKKKEAEYFDDEELDAFKGREATDYSPKEIEMFAEVLHTMRTDEIKDWICSLSKRGVRLPKELKDEAIILSKT
ncbi:MAG: hypothetical protein LUC37_05435, partial [Prevotella sp.]|nr:hypothetical protein [Prevotella sp.]